MFVKRGGKIGALSCEQSGIFLSSTISRRLTDPVGKESFRCPVRSFNTVLFSFLRKGLDRRSRAGGNFCVCGGAGGRKLVKECLQQARVFKSDGEV